jgi:hypothetical protein
MGLLLAITVMFVSLSLAPAQVQAAGHEACIVYSNDAVRKATEAANLRCGFSGPAWSTNPSGHMRWCLGTNEDSIEYEKKKRDSFLFNCRFCRDYANSASQDNKENEQLRCGFSGPRWQSNIESHFRWCVTEPAHSLGPAIAERKARAAELNRCRAAASKEACDRYADEATSSANQNIKFNCGFTGPAWITDRSAHYRWCLQFGSGAAKAEGEGRQAKLKQCTDAIQGRTLGKRKKGSVTSSQGFAGTWDTEMIPGGSFSVTFAQQGSRVTGQFINGSVEGTLEGNDVLDFIVTFPPSVKGRGRLTLYEGGKVFDGRWTFDSDPTRLRGWTGRRR